MAMGEWLSVTTSRESHEPRVDVEAREPADISDEEREHLTNIYSAHGFKTHEARALADRLTTPKREDLGGYAWNAAMSSFLLFAAGALFPVMPFFFVSGTTAVIASILISSAVLFLIGAGVTLFTGRRFLFLRNSTTHHRTSGCRRDLYVRTLHRCSNIELGFPLGPTG